MFGREKMLYAPAAPLIDANRGLAVDTDQEPGSFRLAIVSSRRPLRNRGSLSLVDEGSRPR
jgi:hypothetical protein